MSVPTAIDVKLLGVGNMVEVTGGQATISATAGGDTVSAGTASILFVGASGPNAGFSTLTTGSGNDVVFAETGVNYTAGSGSDTYIGGSIAPGEHSTVNGTTGHDIWFGGTDGDQYNLGGATAIVVNGGGLDTLTGGSMAPIVFSASNGDDKLVNTHPGALLVASGSADTIDASAAGPGSAFFVSMLPATATPRWSGRPAAPLTH